MAKIIPFPGYDPENDELREGEPRENAPREPGDDSDRFRDVDEFAEFDDGPELPQEPGQLPWESLGILQNDVGRLIDADPEEVDDLLVVDPRLTQKDAQSVPILRRVVALLGNVEERGGVAATDKGFLSAKLVKELFNGPYADAEEAFVRVNREGDSQALLFERKLAQKGGLLRLSNRRFTVTRAGTNALENGDYSEIYRRLLTAYLKQTRILEEFDLIEDGGLLSASQLLLLHAGRLGETEPLYEEDLAVLLVQLFPESLAEIPYDYFSPFDTLCHAVALRFFTRFGLPFGLFDEIDGTVPPVAPEEPDGHGHRWEPPGRQEGPWRRTELFDRVFRWGLPAPEAPPLSAEQASEMWLTMAYNADSYTAERYAVLALERDPVNGEAYDLWATLHYNNPNRALRIIEVGLRALGWGSREAHPLSARKAEILLELKRKEEAIETIRTILEKDPTDSLGMRYRLVPLLISEERLEEAEAVQSRYEEESAFFLYNRALIAYARGGAAEARPLLNAALHANPNVPDALTDRALRYKEPPERYTPGSPEEAEIYAAESDIAWRSVKNAKQWIKSWVR